MKIDICAIRNEEAVHFLKENNSRNEVVFDTDSDFWLGAFFEGELIGVNGICYGKNYFKNKSLFVKKTFRKNGCAKLLSKKIIELFGHEKMIAYARPISVYFYEKYFGFETVQKLKNGTEKMVRIIK
jgi:GNAT superfamily N-acetyltransferase